MLNMASNEIKEEVGVKMDNENMAEETRATKPEGHTRVKTVMQDTQLVLFSTVNRLFCQKVMTAPSAIELRKLIDTTSECLAYLNRCIKSKESFERAVIYSLYKKMDPETEQIIKETFNEYPTWEDFKTFLETRCSALETNAMSAPKENLNAGIVCNQNCILCGDCHGLADCELFVSIEPSIRFKYVLKHRLCFVCMLPGHVAATCTVAESCTICSGRHHNILHFTKKAMAEDPPVENKSGFVLLATALVGARCVNGKTITLRALIDPGSQVTIISEYASQLLGLKRMSSESSDIGVSSTDPQVHNIVHLHLISKWNENDQLRTHAFILPTSLPQKVPNSTVTPYTSDTWSHINRIYLADPSFLKPGPVDLLLGVSDYVTILEHGFIKGPPGSPCAQKTSLGWIMFGKIIPKPENQESVQPKCHNNVVAQKKKNVQNFGVKIGDNFFVPSDKALVDEDDEVMFEINLYAPKPK